MVTFIWTSSLLTGCKVESEAPKESEAPPQADIRISPRELLFGDVVVADVNKPDQRVVVKNIGTADLHIKRLYMEDETTDFEILDVLPDTLTPAQEAAFRVRFSPKRAGPEETNVLLQSDVSHKNYLTVRVEGMGVAPDIDWYPESLDFGSVALGTTVTEELSLINLGNAVLNVSNITEDGDDFSWKGDFSFPIILDPHETEIVRISFTPTSPTEERCTFTVTSDDPGWPEVHFSVSGTGK